MQLPDTITDSTKLSCIEGVHAASASNPQTSGSSLAPHCNSTTLVSEKLYLAIQKTEKGRDSIEHLTNMKLTHYLDKLQRSVPSADAQLLNYVSITEMRNKLWWQIQRDELGRVTLTAFKSWITKHEPLYLQGFELALKLHLQPKQVLVSEADLLPHLINLIFSRLCVNLSRKFLQPREMRLILLNNVGAQNLATLYPLLLEYSGLEDADIPDDATNSDLTIEGMMLCTEFVTDLETYFHKKTDVELGTVDHDLERQLAMNASLNWFSESQDDVDARRFALFARQSQKGVVSENNTKQQSHADESSSEDSDEPEPTKIKEFDLKSYSATTEMRDLMKTATAKPVLVKLLPADAKNRKPDVSNLTSKPANIPIGSLSSDETIATGLQMHKKIEWEQALYAYSEFCQRNSCSSLRFLVEHGMTTKCQGSAQQISALGFQSMNVLFSVSLFCECVRMS